MKKLTTILAVALVALFAGSVRAQEDVAANPAATEGAPPAPETDFDQVSKKIGLGVYGLDLLALPAATGTVSDIPMTPAVGARLWLNGGGTGFIKKMGIDAALSLMFGGGSTTTSAGGTSTSTDKPTGWGFGLHAGMPLVLASFKHVNFELTPELNFAYAHASQKTGTTTITDATTRFGLGARAGFEMFFGFVGIPQLALDANVGFAFGYRGSSTTSETGGASNEDDDSSWGFATFQNGKPWDFLVGGLSARYYF